MKSNCPICNGTHFVDRKVHIVIYGVMTLCPVHVQCNFCKGKNDLDWAELISGVDKWNMPVGEDEGLSNYLKDRKNKRKRKTKL